MINATSDLKEALHLLQSEKFDFLLTDIKMPGMDGITLARKALECDPELGILFMTGYADVETAKEAISTGAYDYIMKPFELQEIRHSVSNAIKRRRELQEKGGSKGLSKLSDLMGELYRVGDRQSLLQLMLGFALYHFDINAGLVVLYDSKVKNLRVVSTENIRKSEFLEAEVSLEQELPADVFKTDELQNITNAKNHPLFRYLFEHELFRHIGEKLVKEGCYLTSFSIEANETLKLILTLESECEITIKESDQKLLTVMLSLSAISLENLMLLEESRNAMLKLENLQDQMIGLERIATQGLMSSEIAHELNNFLTIITSNVELLEIKAGTHIPEDAFKYINNIKKHLVKIEKFTTSLSDAGKMESHQSQCDLNEMIDEIATFAVHQRRFHKINVETDLDSNLPILNLDSSQMQQLLYNMLNNAGDAIGPENANGSIKIITKINQDQTSFMLNIKDNGRGFSPDYLAKAFRDRFTTKKTGHGFGLMACKRIIENHGGSVQVDSSEGVGAEIIITLPIIQDIQ